MSLGLMTEFSTEEYQYQPDINPVNDSELNLVNIIQHLHESLDPRTVFACYGHILGQHLPIEAVKMTFPRIHLTWGMHQGIKISHQINFSGGKAKFTYSIKKPLTHSQSQQLKMLQTLMLLPLYNAMQYKEISQQAMYDSLTKLGNRHYYAQSLQKAIANSTRHESSLSMIILDLDNFKTLNDSHGHLLGDKILVEFGQLLTIAMRDTDQAFRIGGDEFVIIVRGDANAASILCERILSLMSSNQLFNQYQATSSLGVSQWQQNETATIVYERADKALYQAKAAGRHCFKVKAA
ncbi:GGDEF domain-containing protein [Shewanella sp. VB17]|uniref:diguanylate cyclase DgcS n=1 Tax=Shewanella sp. VB17 TaxID=2739432 RepID=UPI0015648955|nr:GGDEF domain-containing protein [Shewanella sp. VB17]NRD73179.1 GGDEF domain-containing protein [Shewanella sp. VB17]